MMDDEDEVEAIDPEVQFLLQEGDESVEHLLERVRGAVEKIYQESSEGGINVVPSSASKQQVIKTPRSLDFSTKTIKDLLHYANTRDPQVQSKALDELINRWTSLDAPHQEEYTGEIKGVGGLRILMNLASDNKSSVAPDVVAYQGKLMKLLSLLTENSAIRDQIRQTGHVPTFIQILSSWVSNLLLKKELVVYGLTSLSNLCTDEVNANVIRKLGGIPVIVKLAQTDSNEDVKIATVKTLSMLSSTSVKNQEAIVSETGILDYLFNSICDSTSSNNLDENYRQLLLNLSTCAKSRAIATPKTVLSFLRLLRVVDVYPKLDTYEMRKYYRNSDISFDSFENTNLTNRQSSILDILTNFMQNEHQRQAFARTDGLDIVLSYLNPLYNIPFDMFKWNFTLVTHAIKLCQNLVLEDFIRNSFISKDGYSLMCKFLTLVDVFPPPLLLIAAELISALTSRKSGAQLTREFGTQGLPPLLRLLSMFPTNERLRILASRTINSLATEEKNRITIFQEGGLQALNTLVNSENDEVIAQTCEALSLLSRDKFMRRVIRVMGSLLPVLLNLLSIPKLTFQQPCILVIYNVTLEDEGLDLVADVNNGAAPSLLIPLMQSSEPDIQANSLKILAVCVNKEPYRKKFVEMQGLPTVMGVILSQNVPVQAGAVALLSSLVQYGDCRDILTKLGLVEKLKAFSKHPNVANPNSELVEPMRNLIIKLKSSPITPTVVTSSTSLDKPQLFFHCTHNGETKLLRVPSSITYSNFVTLLRGEFELAHDTVISIQYQYNGRAGVARVNSDVDLQHLIPKLSPSETHQFVIYSVELEHTITPPATDKHVPSPVLARRSSGTSSKKATFVTPEIVQFLGQLDEVQLRRLVIELLRRSPALDIVDAVTKILQEEYLHSMTR